MRMNPPSLAPRVAGQARPSVRPSRQWDMGLAAVGSAGERARRARPPRCWESQDFRSSGTNRVHSIRASWPTYRDSAQGVSDEQQTSFGMRHEVVEAGNQLT